MKKLTIILLSLIISAAAVSCGSDNSDKNSSGNSSASSDAGTSQTQTETQSQDQTKSDKSAEDILASIKEVYGENYLPVTPISDEMLSDQFGLSSDMYTDIAAEMPMIGFHPDRVIIIKAAEGKAEEAQAKLEAARQKLVDDSVQYPANIAKVSASQVVRNGDYVAFFLLGAPDDRTEATEEEALEFARSENAKAVDKFNELTK
ncbi:MAG: DUF4358 domain-containing protein [Oscillospiraceae bacterium]|nr:DUF4358 domain-containing protein [Oscillospiraceae bacterium]